MKTHEFAYGLASDGFVQEDEDNSPAKKKSRAGKNLYIITLAFAAIALYTVAMVFFLDKDKFAGAVGAVVGASSQERTLADLLPVTVSFLFAMAAIYIIYSVISENSDQA